MGKHQLPNRLGLMALENVTIGELLSIMWKSLEPATLMHKYSKSKEGLS